MAGRPKAALVLYESQREMLQAWARRRMTAPALTLRSRISLIKLGLVCFLEVIPPKVRLPQLENSGPAYGLYVNVMIVESEKLPAFNVFCPAGIFPYTVCELLLPPVGMLPLSSAPILPLPQTVV